MADQKNDAEVSVDITGSERVVKAAQAIGDAWRSAAKGASQEWKSFGNAIKGEIGAMARDIGSIATATSKISFSTGAESARRFGLDVQRFAASAGQSAEEVKAKFQSIGRAKMLPDDQVLALSKSLRGVTHDAGYAVRSIGDIVDEAEAMDQSPEKVAQLAGTIRNVWKESGSAGDALKGVRGIVETLKPAGGMTAIHDGLQGIAGAAKNTNLTLKESAALLSTFGQGGKWSQAQREGAAGGVVGQVAQNRRWWENYIRGAGIEGAKERDFLLDKDTGELDASKAMRMVQSAIRKKQGGRAREMFRWQFGDVEGSMFDDWSPDQAQTAVATAGKSETAAAKSEEIRKSWEGRVTKAQQERERNEKTAGGFFGDMFSGYSEFAAEHPVIGATIDKVGGAASSTLGKGTAAAASLMLAKKIGLGGILKAGALAGPWAAGAAGLAGGAMIGRGLDRTFGISDWLSGTGQYSRIGSEDEEAFQSDEKRRALASWEDTRAKGDATLAAGRALLGQGDADMIAAAMTKALGDLSMQAQIIQGSDGTPQKVVLGKAGNARS